MEELRRAISVLGKLKVAKKNGMWVAAITDPSAFTDLGGSLGYRGMGETPQEAIDDLWWTLRQTAESWRE